MNINLNTAFLGPYRQYAFSMKKLQILKGGRNTFKTTRHMTRIILESYLRPNMVSFVIGYHSDKLETGLMSEAEKIADRHGLKLGSSGRGRFIVQDGDYCISKKPREMRFANGSVIHFDGSKNMKALKGRAVKGEKNIFGFILFDEWADYEEKDAANLDIIMDTFSRVDTAQEILEDHFIWRDRLDELVLDSYETDPETGLIKTFINEYGEVKTATTPGNDTLGAKFLFSYNPPKTKESWVYEWEEEYCNRTDAMSMHVNYTDIIPELVAIGQHNIIANAERQRDSNYVKYLHTWLGQPTSVEGLFFHSYVPEESIQDVIPDEFEEIVMGVDFGTSNPTTFVTIGYANFQFYVLDVYYHSNRDSNHTKSVSEFARDLYMLGKENKEKYRVRGQIKCFYDPSAKVLKDEYDKVTRNWRSKPLKLRKANNDRKSSLVLLFEIITRGSFKYHKSLRHLKEMELEIRRAESSKNGDDIVKENDHVIDAIRYALMGLKKIMKKEIINYFLGGVDG